MTILDSIKSDNYKIGNLQAILYRRGDLTFREDLLAWLYFEMKGSGQYSKRSDGMGVLPVLFCGMADLSFPAIVAYLSTIQLVVVGTWIDDKFKVGGVCFPTTTIGKGQERALIAGYGFLREMWGTDEQELLTVLGIAFLFGESNALALHGVRYSSNVLTARYMARFGFEDKGTLPYFLERRGKLVDATLSTLTRVRFEENLQERAKPE